MTEVLQAGHCRFGDYPHAASVLDEVYRQDCYHLQEIPRYAVVIDVGAFYGEFGILCARERECKVIAVEPSRESFRNLIDNVALNLVDPQFIMFNRAVGRCREHRTFLARADHPAGNLFTELASPDLQGRITSVGTLLLSDLTTCARNWRELPSTPIVLKLDCEGAESELFDDADLEHTLEGVAIVTMEWHNRDGKRYADHLEWLGFTVALTGSGHPRPAWEPGMNGGLIFAQR